jgi:hypothetical protein
MIQIWRIYLVNLKYISKKRKKSPAETIFAAKTYIKYVLREMLQFVTDPDTFSPEPAEAHPGQFCG